MSTKTEKLNPETKDRKYTIKLSKPIDFEGKKYEELDLSPIENLTSIDLRECDTLYHRTKQPKNCGKEIDTDYLFIVASRVLDVPMEFLALMSFRDASKLEMKMRTFLLM